MSDPFVAEIRIFPLNFAPTGWALCDGQILPISQNTALFALLGTTYGGNGSTNFALPDMQGNAPMHPGQGLGLSQRALGEQGGTSAITLQQAEMPQHNHNWMTAGNPPPSNAGSPDPSAVLGRSSGGTAYKQNPASFAGMSRSAIGQIGGDQPHNNMQPYLTLNFCIALQGIFPSR